MTKYLIIIIITLLGIIGVGGYYLSSISEKRDIAEANVKAYALKLDESGKETTALALTVSQLKYFNDSILEDLNATRNELKIKDKNLKALAAVSSHFSRTDTITMRDTLFKDPELHLDTLIADEWYKVNVGLRYPSEVIIRPEFKSSKHIVVSKRRETVNPPKKFFLFRLFQKKHDVIVVDVVEKNPYVSDENTRYVEIVK